MQEFFSVMGAIGGIAGIMSVIALFAEIRNNRFLAIHEYLKGFEDPDFIAARSAVYNHNGAASINDKNMAMVVNYYHHWGILAKEGYLPLRIFAEGSVASVMRLYENSKEFIELRKEKEDSTYASGFKWLYDALAQRKK